MSSLELVDFINQNRKEDESELRHADFLTKVPKVLGGDERNFSSIYKDLLNREKPCYRFPKREACLMAMSYSYELQAKVYDRMTELERASIPKLPTTYLDALKALVASEESKAALTMQLDDAKPAVEFRNRYVETKNLKNFREVAKILGVKEREFIDRLIAEKIVFRTNGSLVPFAELLNGDHPKFECKTGETHGHAWTQTRFTAAGIVWVAQKLGLTNGEEAA